jgi:alanine racemase
MAVVKSNAYGHGVKLCAPVFDHAGVQRFGTASVSEALLLRKYVTRKPILALSYVDVTDTELRLAWKLGIRVPAYTMQMLKRFQKVARRSQSPVRMHLKVDTGTTRVGFQLHEMPSVIRYLKKCPKIMVEGIFSHFADAEGESTAFSSLQTKRFVKISQGLAQINKKRFLTHLSCSAGVFRFPEADFSMVRVGMSLYGIGTVTKQQAVSSRSGIDQLRPALSWYTQLIQVKDVPAGTSVGYGRTFRFQRAGKVGILPVGYWEGLDRRLSNKGSVSISGQRVPIRGRICMNLSMVDVTKVKRAKAGTPVELIGPHQPATKTAELAGMIPYDFLTRLNPEIPRVLVP